MTWQMWLVSIPFISMIAAAVAVTLCNNRRPCFGTDPDPLRQAYLKCGDCDDCGECLR